MRIFLKLGGSLITDKDKPYTAEKKIISRIAGEVSAALRADPDLQLLLGHGSGSFGHYAAAAYSTRDSVSSAREWDGFQKVWYAARGLNQIVLDAFQQANLPVISFPPSAGLLTDNRQVKDWTTQPILAALKHGLIPVLYGDVIFDESLGGIIYSTEDLFSALIPKLKPDLILIAGKEPGVWEDYPKNTRLYTSIRAGDHEHILSNLGSSGSTDVTGGMAAKVQLMVDIVRSNPAIQARIFSGSEAGNIQNALSGEALGTTIKY